MKRSVVPFIPRRHCRVPQATAGFARGASRSVGWGSAPLALCALALLTFVPRLALAAPLELSGTWYEAPADLDANCARDFDAARHAAVALPARTGGRYLYVADFEITRPATYVIDFKNSSTIALFRHYLYDARGTLTATSEGGIRSRQENPFSLRHGRVVRLDAGRFRLCSLLDAPFFLAHPIPFIDVREHYQQAIKPGNLLVPLCLGIFLGLGVYYAALAAMRRRLADAMYATFLLGNLAYDGAALLVYSDVFGLHWFYLVSVPILFSNMAYIVFVMALLKITSAGNPRLRRAGVALLMIMLGAAVVAAFRLHWSLELDRAGVALLVSYGVLAGAVRANEGDPIAAAYLVAVAVFFVLAMVAISVSGLQMYTIYVEHLGLLAVSCEAVLLAIVLARQFCLESTGHETARAAF